MRKTLKADNGKGWTLRNARGMAQLRQAVDDGVDSVTLELEWRPDNSRNLLNAVAEIRDQMSQHGYGLKDAQKARLAIHDPSSGVSPATKAINWEEVCARFLEHRSNRRAGTLTDLRTRLRRFLEVMASKPKVTDGPAAMKRFAAMHFTAVYPKGHKRAGQLMAPPGGDGRRRNLRDVAALLDYAVDELGVNPRWKPLTVKKRAELIGSPETNTQTKTHTVPIPPDDLEELLREMLEKKRLDLWLATGLVALYGLRPSELAVMRVDDDGNLWIGGQVKRDLRAIESGLVKQERRVIALELKGQPELGRSLAMHLKAGTIKLPKAIREQISRVKEKDSFKSVGAEFGQQLRRFSYWKTLETKIPGLTPYSLRHGWAWRAHKYSTKPLHYSQAKELMGHSTQVHLTYYSSWVNDAELEMATDRFNEAVRKNVAT